MTGLRPGVRRELVSNLLIGVHPLMAFVPTEGFAELPCDHPVPVGVDFQMFPVVQQVDVSTVPSGLTCPFLIARQTPLCVPCFEAPDVVTNLQRLLQADQLLKRGEELVRGGRFYEAVDCFQEVHRLVPGTNLEARAGTATQDVLVRVYGTSTESGLADEPSEPEHGSDDPPAPPQPGEFASQPTACSHCRQCVARPCAKGESSTACVEAARPRTAVYPVSDLLGKGKETRQDDLEDLVNVIATSVEPKSWAENGGTGTIEYYYRSRALVVRQTNEVHEQIVDLLAALRRAKAECEQDQPKPKPHAAPVARHKEHADAEEGCCEEECCEDNCDQCCPGADCGKCCPDTVLILPAVPAPEDVRGVTFAIEGCTDEPGDVPHPADGFHWTAGGSCAEGCTSPDGVRLRWQIPVGPVTVLLSYEHRELTVGLNVLGLVGGVEIGAEEECETPR
jgi:hypothetical protein